MNVLGPRGRKFFSYYRPYLGLLGADVLCAALLSAVTLVIPLGANYITRHLLSGDVAGALGQIYLIGAGLLALVAIHAACTMFVDYRGHMMGAMMERDMRLELFEHYQKLSFGFYDEQKTGQLMARLTNDLFWMSELCHHGPEDLVIAFLKAAGVFAILININAGLTMLVFLILAIMTAYAFYFNRRMNRALRQSRDRIGDINAQAEDTLAGIRTVISFTNEDTEAGKFARANRRFLASRSQGYKSEAYFSGGMHAFTQLITIAVITFGAAGIVAGALDVAGLLTYLLCVGILVEPIERVVNFSRLYQEGVTGFQRFMDVLEIAPDIRDAPGARELGRVRGAVSFQDVSFRYKSEHRHVLETISLDIRPGEYVALVGSSGAGKTTLCSLIPRFYEASAGRVLIDGADIRDVSLRSLRANIGVVQQDVYLFAGTVAENIRYGRLDASDAEVVAAAKKANAHDFIMELPNGYDTDIGQRGVKLSGGQKQRLSIARVFLKDPPIIIFDEATSALDNESERAVQQSLEALADNRTTLVI
ncbi:MAG TPA: ABC transporter ATP-binding protein, partial [Herpetosiphonaceae bacterium]|nr:ABC transporter ATP-binding protein [Herpetosiphonaceae bacterium]